MLKAASPARPQKAPPSHHSNRRDSWFEGTVDLLRPTIPSQLISFFIFNFHGVDQNLHDPVIISIVAGNFIFRKVLVDLGCSTDILFYSYLRRCSLIRLLSFLIMEICLNYLGSVLGSKLYLVEEDFWDQAENEDDKCSIPCH